MLLMVELSFRISRGEDVYQVDTHTFSEFEKYIVQARGILHVPGSEYRSWVIHICKDIGCTIDIGEVISNTEFPGCRPSTSSRKGEEVDW